MFDADSIVANRQLRRRLSLWRVVAIVTLGLAVGLLVYLGAETNGGFSKYSNHLARVRVEGLITGKRQTLEMLQELAKTDRVKAVIVHIDSPGGTTAGSEALYEEIRKIADKKPVVSVMGTIAASGGYITAIATDHIVARGNTITGSIGVIFQWAEVSQLLDKLGVKMEEIKSGELKAEPNMFNPLSERVREVTEILVQDSYGWFVGLVADRRKLDAATAGRLADGRVYSGRQAVANKLIDAIGGEEQAKAWLVAQRQINAKLKVIDWEPKSALETKSLGLSLLSLVLRLFGVDQPDRILGGALDPDRLKLDGLLSVWHPSG